MEGDAARLAVLLCLSALCLFLAGYVLGPCLRCVCGAKEEEEDKQTIKIDSDSEDETEVYRRAAEPPKPLEVRLTKDEFGNTYAS